MDSILLGNDSPAISEHVTPPTHNPVSNLIIIDFVMHSIKTTRELLLSLNHTYIVAHN